MSVKLLHITENYAKTIEYAARTSTATKTAEERLLNKANKIRDGISEEEPYSEEYLSLMQQSMQEVIHGKEAEDFVRKLIEKGHISIGRQCMASFEVICSRACGNQLVRSVHLGIIQESQRYVKFKISPDTDQYVIPESIQKNGGKLFEDFLDCLETIEAVYDNLISNRIPKEDARYVLPNACKTRLVVSGNFQAISDFCCLRNQIEAQWEIREIAREIFEIMAKEAPAYFEYFRGKDGYCKRKVWE